MRTLTTHPPFLAGTPGAATSPRTPALDVDAVAWRLADSGPADHDGDLEALARLARRAGAPGAAVDVLLDAHAPAVARLRAFAVLARRLGH